MGTQEVTIGGQTTINVSLIVSTKNLEEVVIVGYGTQKRADVTGSVATVKSQDIENKPFTSIDKHCKGRLRVYNPLPVPRHRVQTNAFS